MPKTKVQKQELVTELSDKLSKAGSVVFADYQGLTMAELSDLRSKLGEDSAEFTVTKNNLMEIALKNNELSVNDDVLTGPTATLFAFGDQITPIKTLTKFLKDTQKGKIRGGMLSGEFMDAQKVNKLATLPSKDELRGKTVGVLVAPLHGIVGVLQANLRNVVYALEQIRTMKSSQSS